MRDYQVPRSGFAWLLFTQAFLLLPHLLEFPLILLPVWLVCTFWRVMIYQGRWNYPSAVIKTVLVAASFLVLVLIQKRWLTVETAILTLLIAFLLKLLEMKQLRDVLIIIYLAYFVIVAELLLSQTILSGFYLILSLLMVTATLIAIQSAVNETPLFYPVVHALKMLVLSLPIMVVAFLVFPRLEPLWTVPMPAGSGKTGVSGSMSPGLFSRLAQSDELAFRVKFDGDVPPLKTLYWRGVVLTRFDGQTWLPILEQGDQKPPLDDITINAGSASYHYRMTMEPSYQEWIFTLAGVINTDTRVNYLRDFTVKHEGIIDKRESWKFTSVIDATLGAEIYRYHRKATLLLPEGLNPKTLIFAQELYAKSVSNDDYIQKVLDHFRNNAFYYTLNPPLLGKNSVDDFLFNTRRGFCEHYASAFVVLMRAAGIPARVIAGYQGGDINPFEKHVTVRQLDAHAWAEVWMTGKGWVRIDPTYAVAPERIEKGGQESLQAEENFLAETPFSPLHYRDISWLKRLQYRFDQANYLWHSWILDYTNTRQQSVLLALLGSTSPQFIAFLVGGVFIAFSLLMALYITLRYRPLPLSPVEKIYRKYLKKLAKKGLKKAQGEGAVDFARKAKSKWPKSALMIDDIVQQYLILNYSALPQNVQETRLLKQFRRDVIKLKLQ